MGTFTPSDVLTADPVAMATYERFRLELSALGPGDVRTTKNQVAFRRRRGFAWLWRPGMYVRSATVPVVLTIALGRHEPCPRFKEVVHPYPGHWIYHLGATDLALIGEEVVGWLREAGEEAAQASDHG